MKKIFYVLFMVLVCCNAGGQTEPLIPHLKQQGDSKQLIVNGKPIILLSAELTNSAGSSMSYMEPVWPRLKRMNLNSVIAPVYWELIEPEEGKSPDEYLVAGDGFSMKFISKSKEQPHAELLWAYELIYKENEWTRQRRLNGDETGSGSDHNVELRFFENKPAVSTAKIFSYE